MAERYRDYDAAFAEANNDSPPIVIHLFGEDWRLPGDPPAGVMIRLARMMADGRENDQVTDTEMMTLAMDAVPAPTLEAWTDRGLTIQQLTVILEDIINEYGAQLNVGGDTPEDPPPETGASTSSTSSLPIGDLSKPTSNANTSSRFRLR